MDNCHCHKDGKSCGHHCNAYSGEELPYGFKKTGHCIELANQHLLITNISSLTLKVKGLKDSLDTVERTLQRITIEAYS